MSDPIGAELQAAADTLASGAYTGLPMPVILALEPMLRSWAFWPGCTACGSHPDELLGVARFINGGTPDA